MLENEKGENTDISMFSPLWKWQGQKDLTLGTRFWSDVGRFSRRFKAIRIGSHRPRQSSNKRRDIAKSDTLRNTKA